MHLIAPRKTLVIDLDLLSLFGWLASRRQSVLVADVSVTPGRQLD